MVAEQTGGRPDASFGAALIKLLPRLKRFAYGLCRNLAQADDIVQSACERALKARESWEEGTRLDAWMFRIIRNLWIDGLRHQRVTGPQESMDENFELAGSDGRREQEARHFLGQVQRAILELPDDMREVLMLVCVEEQSYKDAAEVLGIPVGTVMSRLARARLRLAEKTGYRPGEDDE